MDDESLNQLVETIEAWQAHREAMRLRCAAWLRSPAFRTAFYDNTHPPLALKATLELEVGKAKAAEMWSDVLGVQSSELWQQYQQLATRGQVVFAHTVIVNPQLMKEKNRNLPCLMVVSEDQGSAAVAYADLLAAAAGELYTMGEGAEERPKLFALVRDDEFQLFRRRVLPKEEIQGFAAVFLDIQLRNTWMPPLAEVPFVPLLIMPGGGAVMQIPWSIATGAPPLPGTMEKGIFADFAEIGRQADDMLAKHNAKANATSWLQKIAGAMVLFGVIGGLYMKYFDKSLSDSSKPHESQKPVRWAQPVAVDKNISIVPAKDYDPLIGEGAAGSGFIFWVKPGIYLAATIRHQFGDPGKAPKTLFDSENREVILDIDQVMRFPESQIQMVSAVKQRVSSLTYQSSDVIDAGDELWLILGKRQRVIGKLTTTGRHPLSSPPALLRMAVTTSENVAGSSGSPIVHAKTGRVVGVMQGANKAQSPTILSFETLNLLLD